MELLLEGRADIDVQDNQRRTPLHLAVDEGKVAAVQLLLKRGANVHARNDNRQTPLQLAEARENQEIIQLFSENMLHE
jgi:ankyrin repeat protein